MSFGQHSKNGINLDSKLNHVVKLVRQKHIYYFCVNSDRTQSINFII